MEMRRRAKETQVEVGDVVKGEKGNGDQRLNKALEAPGDAAKRISWRVNGYLIVGLRSHGFNPLTANPPVPLYT